MIKTIYSFISKPFKKSIRLSIAPCPTHLEHLLKANVNSMSLSEFSLITCSLSLVSSPSLTYLALLTYSHNYSQPSSKRLLHIVLATLFSSITSPNISRPALYKSFTKFVESFIFHFLKLNLIHSKSVGL